MLRLDEFRIADESSVIERNPLIIKGDPKRLGDLRFALYCYGKVDGEVLRFGLEEATPLLIAGHLACWFVVRGREIKNGFVLLARMGGKPYDALSVVACTDESIGGYLKAMTAEVTSWNNSMLGLERSWYAEMARLPAIPRNLWPMEPTTLLRVVRTIEARLVPLDENGLTELDRHLVEDATFGRRRRPAVG